jgi:uncharacterized protein (TIGR03067 family)
MRLALAWLPAIVLLAGCGSAPDPVDERAAPPEDPLRGQWKLVCFERWGGPWQDHEVGQTWEFTGKEIACPDGTPFRVAGSYRNRPRNAPKEIDIKTAKGKEIPGIYSIEGDTLKLCVDTQNSRRRPTEFASQGKSEIWLFVFERVKPAVARSE